MLTKDQLYTKNNVRKTRSLFKEYALPEDTPIFTLSHNDHDGFINLRNIFIPHVVRDPTEAEFAEVVFGDPYHWELIAKAPWIQSYLKEWRHIADVKRKALAFKAIINEVEKDGRSAFSAAKYLIEEPWKPKTKVVKDAKTKSTNEARQSVQKDFDRIAEFLPKEKVK